MSDDRRPFTPRRSHSLPPEVYSESGRRFFLTTRALGGKKPFTTPARCRIVVEELARQRVALNCWVGPYCLMPDHLHIICGPGPAGHSVLELVQRLHGATTNALWPTGWSGLVWQPGAFDTLLEDEHDLLQAGEYVLLNPVRAGLVAEADDWPWSGWLDGLNDPPPTSGDGGTEKDRFESERPTRGLPTA